MMHTRTLLAATLVGLTLATAGCGDSSDALLAKARKSIAAKEPKAAEIHLKNLLQKEDRAEARFLLGQVHAASGDFRSAEKEFERALEAGFDKVQAGLALADVQFNLGDMAKVLSRTATLGPSQPADQARLHTLTGRALLATGKPVEAEKSFQDALTAVPGHLPAQIGLIMLAASRDIKAAAAQVDALLAKAPDSTDVLSLKGDLELAQGRQAEAAAAYTKVAAGEPLNRAARAKLASIAGEAKDYAGAQKWIDELKKLTGPAPGTMHLQALNDFRQGKNEAARDAVLMGLKNSPDYLPSVALAAAIYLNLNALEQAEANARTVLEKAPNSSLGYRLLGATYLRLNAPDRALQTVQPAIDRGAKDPVLLGIAGEAALKLNEPGKAAEYFSKAAAIAPDDPAQKTGRGVARIAAGDKERGIADLEAAAELTSTTSQADLALVTQHLRDKQWDKASAAVERLDKKQPNNPLVNNLRGTVSLGKGDIPAARKFFEASLAQDPTFFAAASNLSALDLRDKKVEDARKRYTTLLEKDPKNVRAMLTLAQVIQGTGGDRKQVLEWLTKARAADKNSVATSMALARFHLGNNEPKEVIPILQEAVSAAPDRLELLDALGTAYLKAGDEAQAIKTFERILRVRPDSAPLQLRMGEFHMSRKEFDRALAYFRKSAELSPKAVEPKAAIASALASLGKIDEARAIATALQKEAPRSAAGAVLDGDILVFDKKYTEAAVSYRKALAVQKVLPISLKLHRTLLAAGKDGEADALLKTLLAENPQDISVKGYAAMTEIGRKRWAQAIPLYREVVAAQPNNALALNNLAWAQYEDKDPGALASAEKAYSIAPKSPEVLDTYGTILLAGGNPAKASDILKQAVAAAPKAYGFRLRLAEALIARGDTGDARKEIEVILAEVKTGPVREMAQALVKKL